MYTPKIEMEIDSRSVEELISNMKELSPKAITQLRRDMRTALMPIANQVVNQVPTESPFKGMNRNLYGRVQWAPPKGRIAVTPAKSAKRRGWAPLVTLILTNKERLGFDYSEHAGSRRKPVRPVSKKYKRKIDNVERSHAVTTQGRHLIEKAREESPWNYKAGHFAYGKFLSLQPQMVVIAGAIIDKVMLEFNVKNRRR